jgi:hypothetical protein
LLSLWRVSSHRQPAGSCTPAGKRSQLSLGSASEPPYMQAGNSCSGGCGNDLGSSVGLVDLACDPDGRDLRGRHMGVAPYPLMAGATGRSVASGAARLTCLRARHQAVALAIGRALRVSS